MITEQDIQMMDDFSEDAADLLKGLLQRDPRERLGNMEDGVEEIKNHSFFDGIDWEALARREI